MQTSLKLKTFYRFFIAFLKFKFILEYFEKKDQSHSLSITEIIYCETDSVLNIQKAAEISTEPVSNYSSINLR